MLSTFCVLVRNNVVANRCVRPIGIPQMLGRHMGLPLRVTNDSPQAEGYKQWGNISAKNNSLLQIHTVQ